MAAESGRRRMRRRKRAWWGFGRLGEEIPIDEEESGWVGQADSL
jgi:hypothetical protein